VYQGTWIGPFGDIVNSCSRSPVESIQDRA
jgi:hypothetical protein